MILVWSEQLRKGHTLDERKRLQQTALRFGSEVERIVGSNFIDMPAPLERLLDALDSEPLISAYVNDCVDKHLPTGFDATAEVDRVTDESSGVFGPFSEDHRGASAERYLIVSELVERGTKFRSPVFHGYGHGSGRLQDQAEHFMDEMVIALIDDVNAHLQAMADALGLNDLLDTQDAADDAQADIVGPERIDYLLRELESSVRELPLDLREDALLQVEALSDELACEEPKRSVVRVVLLGLKSTDAGAHFAMAVEQLEACLKAAGIA